MSGKYVLARQSPFSGKEHTMELPLTEREFNTGQLKRNQGMLIQDAFPQLNADQREFIMTGITPEEWAETFGEDDES